jgi:hypothetical protein
MRHSLPQLTGLARIIFYIGLTSRQQREEIFSLLHCNYRIFVPKHQVLETHLLDNTGRIRKLRCAGKTGRSPHRSSNPAMSVQTGIPPNEPVEFTADIQAIQRPLFAQAA